MNTLFSLLFLSWFTDVSIAVAVVVALSSIRTSAIVGSLFLVFVLIYEIISLFVSCAECNYRIHPIFLFSGALLVFLAVLLRLIFHKIYPPQIVSQWE